MRYPYIRLGDSYAVGSTVLKAFSNKRFKTKSTRATRPCSVPHPPTRLHIICRNCFLNFYFISLSYNGLFLLTLLPFFSFYRINIFILYCIFYYFCYFVIYYFLSNFVIVFIVFIL